MFSVKSLAADDDAPVAGVGQVMVDGVAHHEDQQSAGDAQNRFAAGSAAFQLFLGGAELFLQANGGSPVFR